MQWLHKTLISGTLSTYLHVLLNKFLGFCSDVDEVSYLPGCDTVSNPRRTDTSCPINLVPPKTLSHLHLFPNTMLCIASDEMGSDQCIKLYITYTHISYKCFIILASTLCGQTLARRTIYWWLLHHLLSTRCSYSIRASNTRTNWKQNLHRGYWDCTTVDWLHERSHWGRRESCPRGMQLALQAIQFNQSCW
jgi:hypothetical protein